MPLIDLDALPPLRKRSWEGFHSQWAACITTQLNGARLPPHFHAEPLTQAGMRVEADVSIFEEEADLDEGNGQEGEGGVATAVYAPPKPTLVAPVEFGTLDIYEVRVYDDKGPRALVAVVELVSPSNKDRPAHREAFATKCAAYLQQNVSVVVVDIVTERREGLHGPLMRRLELGEELVAAVHSDLYAVAYRSAGRGARTRLEAWPFNLAVGADLPSVPMWLGADLAVPLELEASFAATLASLRMRTP